jgi:hypothetical protein
VSILLVSLLLMNSRRWDWLVAIGVMAIAIVRTATQAPPGEPASLNPWPALWVPRP